MDNALIKVKNISKSYHIGHNVPERIVLENINLEINKAETLAITGPSGSGKSTLLNIIGSMDTADSGELWYKNEKISDLTTLQRSNFRNKHIGFIFQQHHLLPQLSLIENVLLPLLEEKDKALRKEGLKRAKDLISWTGLEKQQDQFPWQLSGGELQRASVVRSLINEPSLVLADEPTGSLDEDNAQMLVDLLLKINREKGISIVMVTHDNKLAAKMGKQYLLTQSTLVEIK